MKREPGRKRKQPPSSEQALLASVRSVAVSCYVREHRVSVADDAITDVLCDIVSMQPEMPKHLGKQMIRSLMCPRKYDLVDDPKRNASAEH